MTYHIQGVYLYNFYSPVSHSDFFIINIAIAATHILAASILSFSYAFHNTNVTIHDILFFSSLPYYLDRLERSYPKITLNQYGSPFYLQFMNRIQGTKLAGRK